MSLNSLHDYKELGKAFRKEIFLLLHKNFFILYEILNRNNENGMDNDKVYIKMVERNICCLMKIFNNIFSIFKKEKKAK